MKKLLSFTLALSVLLIVIGGVRANSWFDTDWPYRRPVTISNPCAEVTGYQVQVTLDSSFDFNHALTDGSDLRVTDSDGETPIPFWIEEWDSGVPIARIWVKVPSIPTGGTAIYLYYGNDLAVSTSDGWSTFEAYDGFEDYEVGSIPVGAAGTGYWNKYEGNPILTGSRDCFGSTFYDNDTGIYHHFTSYGSVFHYTSSDGKEWVADPDNPVLSGNNQGVPMAWKEDGTWYMLYRYGSPTYHIGLATSSDASNWTESGENPVLTGTPGEWDDTTLDPWGVIKVADTYYMWYNTIGGVPGLGRCIGLATSTNLTDWNKDPNNPIFTGGRFCAFPFKYDDTYYLLVPHYTSGSDYSKYELYRDSNPTFYDGEREYLGVAVDIGAPGQWDDLDQDTPCVLTDTIYRDTYEASNNELWVYYAGNGGSGWGQTGMVIEEDIAEAIARVEAQAKFVSWSTNCATVVDDPVRQGVRSVRQHDTSATSSCTLTGGFPQQTSGVVGAWMRRGAYTATTDDYDIYLYGGQLSCVAGLGRFGNFHYWDGSFHSTGVSWGPDTWYLVTIAFDVAQQNYDFIVYDEDLTELVHEEEIGFGRSSTFISSAMLYASREYVGYAYADDFRVRKWCGQDAITTVGQRVLMVPIDIKPGSYPNSINNDGHGVIPVAILSDPSIGFDATQVDPGTVVMSGLSVRARGKANKLLAHYEDVDGDGYADLVVQIEDEDGTFQVGDSTATVTGLLADGTSIMGTDTIRIVPPGM